MTPTPRQETGMALIAATTMIILIIILALCSCSTTKNVVEQITVHDTVFSHHTDTVKDVKVLHLTDTVKLQEVHTYTVNAAGDTVRENHCLIEHNKMVIIDSTFRYQSERDSLRQALYEAQNKDKVIVKEKKVMAWWGWIIVGCSLIPIIIFFVNRLIIRTLTQG